jgi:hypothetical protein
MAHSYKKIAAGGNTKARSDKAFKQQEHQSYRNRIRTLLRSKDFTDEDFDIPIVEKEFGDPWTSPKDGHRVYKNLNAENYQKELRK